MNATVSNGSGSARFELPLDQKRVKYVTTIDKIPQLSESERERLRAVTEQYVFRANDYYLSLINWDDPNDPIRQLVIPREEENKEWGQLDASNEQAVTVAPGVQHKYFDTALLICNDVCGAYCRYCFRKRLFQDDNDEVTKDLTEGFAYIEKHPEISNVLLTGGDPLLMSTNRIRQIVERLDAIPHVRIIRFGSKMPAFDPYRILRDPELQTLFKDYSSTKTRIYLMAHFDHPVELTEVAIEGLQAYLDSGVVCVNQCPLIKGINDDPDVLAEMYQKLSIIGVPPYYLFQCRPTAGNEPYSISLVEGYRIYNQALRQGSGLARRAKFSMSHASGKLEIVLVDNNHIYLKYHQAKDPENLGKILICRRDDKAGWFDDLEVLETVQP